MLALTSKLVQEKRSRSNALRSGPIWALAMVMLLTSRPMFSQSFTGRILGSVTDQSGAAVSDATVTITDAQRGITRALSTDQAGLYVAPNLSPGTYKVRVEAKGFKTVERVNVPVEVAKDVSID